MLSDNEYDDELLDSVGVDVVLDNDDGPDKQRGPDNDDGVEESKVGMTFASEEEVWSCYIKYA